MAEDFAVLQRRGGIAIANVDLPTSVFLGAMFVKVELAAAGDVVPVGRVVTFALAVTSLPGLCHNNRREFDRGLHVQRPPEMCFAAAYEVMF
jgi:hypothetical protein